MDSRLLGNVSIDTGELALVDAMYLFTDENHDNERTGVQVLTGYDGVVAVTGDGTFPVVLDVEDGVPRRIRIELG